MKQSPASMARSGGENKSIFRVLYIVLTCGSPRKWENCCQAGLCFLVIFGLYATTSYYSFNYDKVHSFQELINETVFTESSSTEAAVATTTTQRPKLFNETVIVPTSIQIGVVIPNCGLADPCKEGRFAVHLYSGKDHRDEPRLCVDGKYVLSKDVNGGGRGINGVVVDNMTRAVTRVFHFDTYEKESTALETLLLTLRPGDIVVLLTFDEPTRKLSRVARLLLFELGSALIQNLGYRGSWYLVSQKGIDGFSPYEKLHMVESNGWPKHHDVRMCVPFAVKGRIVHPDPASQTNPSRVQFCHGRHNFPLFCDADVVNDPLQPSPVWKQSASINRIYDVPVLVMSGEDVDFLPLTLETLVRQPGIKPSTVAVFYLPKHKEVPNLTDLFGFNSEELSNSVVYCERVREAFEMAHLLYPEAKELILLGENVLLAPDFLYFLGQLLSLLRSDPSLLAVSAFNENGFKNVSGDPTLLYRVDSFSGLAVLVRRNFFRKGWCASRFLADPLYLSTDIGGECVVPDVSRATLSRPSSPHTVASQLFAYDRTVTSEQNIAVSEVEKLHREEYEKELETLLSSALALREEDPPCPDAELLEGLLRNTSRSVLALHFSQKDERDFSAAKRLTACFGLRPPPRGFYRGLLRFLLRDRPAFLVGSASPFAGASPAPLPR